MAEKGFVVEIDAGDDGDGRRKNVGGIEAAAKANFEDAKFNSVAGERFEGHSGDAFEVSRMPAEFAGGEQFFDQDLDARKGFGEGCIADFLAINADAFVDSFKMWRSIEPGSKAGSANDRFEER